MPPEPLPWDRKDFFKEKKYERPEALGPVSRWRDCHSHHGSRELARWGSDELRRPPGHGKQGGYQLFSEESGHGCTPSRSSERMVEDELCRPSASRAEWKYGRNNRENKGFFSQKEWKGHLLDTSDASVCSSGRQHDLSSHRSVDDLLTYTSHPHSDIENSSWDQLHLKDYHDKMGAVDGLATGHRYDKDHTLGSIAWKPLKWTRSSSLSSRGSGFSHSSSSKSTRADLDDTKLESQDGKATPFQSSSGDAAAGVTSSTPFEDTCSRKKQRLGWGQGLAKYEKEKVEGHDETTCKSELLPCSNNMRTSNGSIPSLSDKSPRVTGLSECASPATPSSVACSSSPAGMEDKPYNKVSNIDNDASNLSSSPGHGCHSCLEGFSAIAENLELNPLASLNSLLADFLQAEDASSGDSSFVKSTAMNKLMLLKGDILKALEKTECEIDLHESELKCLSSEPKRTDSCLIASKFLQVEGALKPCEAADDSEPGPLKVVEEPLLCNDRLDEVNCEIKDVDIYSPGTASSKCVEPLSLEKQVSLSDVVKHDDCSVACDNAMPHSDTESVLHASILAYNRDCARKASEVFNKLLPSDRDQTNTVGCNSVSSVQNNLLIKEKLAMRKCFIKFKERVLTLKYRAFQHLWREDMRLISLRKCRARSQKRFELSSRTLHNGSQKHRSSIHSRFTSPGNLTLVPTTEIVDFAGKLLSDSQIKVCRNSLRMPALLLDEKEKRLSSLVTSNGLVEDPCAVEKERAMINPWTSKEKEIFMEMLATFGKDFKKISSFLDHKTTADCIEFYYKNQKSESFEKIKKKLELRKQEQSFPSNTYLVTSGKKWNRDGNAASLDLLGAASVIAATADANFKTKQNCGGKLFLGGYNDHSLSQGDDCNLEGSSSVDILGNEREAAAADVLVGICGALSSEAMSSCVTSSIDPGEGCQEWKRQKVSSVKDRLLTPEVSQNIDDEETCSDESCGELDSVDWTDEEKSVFIQALRLYGRDFAKISRYVRTRSRDQCRIFFSKARKCLGLDVLYPGTVNEEMPGSDTNGGRSDTEDACLVELESAICSNQSCSKMEVDLASSVTNMNGGVSLQVEPSHLQIDLDRSGEKHGIETQNREASEMKVETMVPDECRAGAESAKVLDADNNSIGPEVVNRDDVNVDVVLNSEPNVQLSGSVALADEREIVKEPHTDKVIVPKEEPVSACEQEEVGQFKSIAAADLHPLPCSDCEDSKVDLDKRQEVSEKVLIDGQDPANGIDRNSCTGTSCIFTTESSAKREGVNPAYTLPATYPHQIPLELLSSIQKPQVVSWQQKENVPSVSVGLDSSVHCKDQLKQCRASSSTLDFVVHGDKQQQKSSSADVFQQILLGHESLNRVEHSQILKGYPLQVLNKNAKNTDVDTKSGEESSKVQSFSKMERKSQHSQYMQELYHEKCNSSRFTHSVAELPLLPKGQEPSPIDHPRPHSWSSSDTEEQSRRTGDVKLFGQILSHPTPASKRNSSSPENNENGASSKLGSSSFNLKSTSNHAVDGVAVSIKLDNSNYSGLEDFPARSHGFWDGSRIQTGLSSQPDSAMLLAKYPAAFGDYSAPSCRVGKQPVPVVKRNDLNMGCVSVFPTKDLDGIGGLADYQAYRSYDGTKLQPFTTVDVKGHGIFSELEKRNGFEVTSFQQQGRSVVGGGILVGGNCPGVSDPVAAIKMHYATSERQRYSGQAQASSSSSTREDESWHGGGDLGRR
ncbi:PREDICTED: uncharacterized protein LOC104594807 isoform X3 [Nelumbo nucifera]|uniref:Uncharacterized protein LOC104594807 isoform X3 n=1 Tax=Nelumbo nucifera TaxID=4432 RepID=A0A1U7ZP52_NELNU|nr:PREDICTED: uncharacterized protein LOC104594807 isoform X3 [Nelumbo nucifera]